MPIPTSATRLEIVPATNCRLRWTGTLYGYEANGTRKIIETTYGYEDSGVTASTTLRLITPNSAIGDDLSLLSFQVAPVAISGSTVALTLRRGVVNPTNPTGAPLSFTVLDIQTLEVGEVLHLDAGRGAWFIDTVRTRIPLW